jgi:hypothetical protein
VDAAMLMVLNFGSLFSKIKDQRAGSWCRCNLAPQNAFLQQHSFGDCARCLDIPALLV